jgi:hypothetical protein
MDDPFCSVFAIVWQYAGAADIDPSISAPPVPHLA